MKKGLRWKAKIYYAPRKDSRLGEPRTCRAMSRESYPIDYESAWWANHYTIALDKYINISWCVGTVRVRSGRSEVRVADGLDLSTTSRHIQQIHNKVISIFWDAVDLSYIYWSKIRRRFTCMRPYRREPTAYDESQRRIARVEYDFYPLQHNTTRRRHIYMQLSA